MGQTSYIHWLRRHVGSQKTIVVYVSVAAFDEQGRILLQLRADTGVWGLPGGVIEPGEGLLDCARRETEEETGFLVGGLRLVGIYTDPRYDSIYPNGDQVQQFTTCLQGRIEGGRLQPDPEESREVRFFAPAHLPLNQMPSFYQEMCRDALRGGPPSFEPPHALAYLTNVIDQVRPRIGHAVYIGAGTMVAAQRQDGRVLAVRRADNGYWSLPGGFLHLGENAAHCAQRETEEETGVVVEIQRLVGVSSPLTPWVYPNGDQTIAVVTHFAARPLHGALLPDIEEISQVAWLPPAAIIDQPYHAILTPSHSAILAALDPATPPFII